MNKEITYGVKDQPHVSLIYKILSPAGNKARKEKSKRLASLVRKGFNKVFYTEG